MTTMHSKLTNCFKKILLGVASCFLLASLFSCSNNQHGSSNKDNSLNAVLESGKFVLGLDVSFPPMGFLDENNEIVGFDIDVAKEVCTRLGVELVTKSIDWDKKEEELNTHQIDCIWNGFTITPSRTETINFTEPYMKNEIIVVVPSTSDIRNIKDLSGKKVGAQSGSTSQEVMEGLSNYSEMTASTYENATTLLDHLSNNDIDAAILDSVVAYYLIFANEGQFYILSDSLAEEVFGVGFRKKDQALRNKVQELMSDMKADGTLGSISKKWFGSDITTVR